MIIYPSKWSILTPKYTINPPIHQIYNDNYESHNKVGGLLQLFFIYIWMDYEFRNMGGVYNIKQVGVHSPPPFVKVAPVINL